MKGDSTLMFTGAREERNQRIDQYRAAGAVAQRMAQRGAAWVDDHKDAADRTRRHRWKRHESVGSSLLDHRELEVALDNQVAINVALALHLDEAELGLEGGELHLHHESVAGDNWAAPLDVVHAREEEVALAGSASREQLGVETRKTRKKVFQVIF